jgi:2-polyprenyl-6-hydroxyphenyl methylase/3-demethylubiquinone-9 3-methyltransferase
VGPGAQLLDVGCGAGFSSNYLAREGFQVTGIDTSQDSLAVARQHDATGRVRYESCDALALPFADGQFDAVCSMDFLEHVDAPERVVAETARVLRPGGVFFFHTFNRNWLSWLVAIKGVEWFVKNTPPHLHVLNLFIKPGELQRMCEANGLTVRRLHGSAPVVFSRAFLRLLTTGVVDDEFRFRFTRFTGVGYIGYAVKQ